MAEKPLEEQDFKVMLEKVEQHYQLLSERVTGLDQKITQEFGEVRRDFSIKYEDLQTGIRSLVKKIQEHRHDR